MSENMVFLSQLAWNHIIITITTIATITTIIVILAATPAITKS